MLPFELLFARFETLFVHALAILHSVQHCQDVATMLQRHDDLVRVLESVEISVCSS